MSNPVSIMPCLDMQNGRVVKGVHFVDIADAGDPVECARAYCAAGADELALLDLCATLLILAIVSLSTRFISRVSPDKTLRVL